ncbi:alpha/beta hydrolase family protein [Labilibacter marinus]|uniref:hypothetical protein n=1 Tax=Labilibacter marinus TaxID=1477105 RepID=UPI000834D1B1|nr:hypothetical protein [Labilibacter marinus]
MFKYILYIPICLIILTGCQTKTTEEELWHHINVGRVLADSRGMKAEMQQSTENKTLYITSSAKARNTWCTIPAPQGGWNLNTSEFIEAQFTNTGTSPIEVLFWIKAGKGWDAVSASEKIEVGETKTLQCNLRDTFPDGTPLINPNFIDKIQVMLVNPQVGSKLRVSNLIKKGKLPQWQMPAGKLELPDITYEQAAAGKRVQYQTASIKDSEKYVALYLPKDWQAGKKYPVVVEFPGNIWFTKDCYSTGRPEACTIGYGMSKGNGAIWVSMPFVDNVINQITENGWGNPNHTADLTIETVNEIIKNFGGDKDRLILTGFSRGAIACGFIGLRNDTIASMWKGLHACQHYDGDGWGKANINEAKERLQKFKGSYFMTDNNKEELKSMLKETGVKATFASSNLNAHATAMFLDNRPSTLALREWYQELIRINDSIN